MEKLTHWKKETNPNYLGSWDLLTGADANGKAIYGDKIFTIKTVEKRAVVDMENIKKNPNATKDEIVITFEEFDKPMIIHAKANFKGIEQATGTPFIEYWTGRKICVHVEPGVKAFGTVTDALRIKKVPERKCNICGKVIDEKTYQQSKIKYGMPLCSSTCKARAGIK